MAAAAPPGEKSAGMSSKPMIRCLNDEFMILSFAQRSSSAVALRNPGEITAGVTLVPARTAG